MLTLLEVRGPGGRVRRCDDGCLSAEGGRCRCVCCGVNHGVGVNMAIENARECLEWWRDVEHDRRCGEVGELRQVTDQPWLFE